MVTRNCNECQAPYKAEQRYLNRGQGLFCSRACSALYHGRLKLSPNITCDGCGVEFHRPARRSTGDKQRFCSLQCMNTNIHRGHGESQYGYCRFCDKRLQGANSSGACKSCLDFDTFCRWWNGDSEAGTMGTYGAKTFVKQVLIELNGDRCEQCGYDQRRTDGASIIQMDHIDGNCTNNLKENLRLLCPNCHAHTETYGARNKGSGRSHRRKNG